MNRVRRFVLPLCLLFAFIALSSVYIDYGYIAWAARIKLSGTPVTCENIHGNQWRLFPECVALRGSAE